MFLNKDFFGKGELKEEDKKSKELSPYKRKMEYLKLLPFNIQGNKAELLTNGLGDLVLKAANSSEHVIDAFAGTGLYIHFLRAEGFKKPMILNEFDSYRYITHKQIKDNPIGVRITAKYYLNRLIEMVEQFKDGDIFGPSATAIQKDIVDFLHKEAERLVEPGQYFDELFLDNKPVKMKNTPETAALYIVAQNQKFGYRPIQADATAKGLKKIMNYHEIRTIVKEKNQKIKKFRVGREILFNLGERIESVHRRLKNVSICNGDGWKLIRENAGKGDFVPVDTSYLGKNTNNYNKATGEDCNPEVYMRKVKECILPATKRGAKLLITNNWYDEIVAELRLLGFAILKLKRAKGVSRDRTEFAAINFDPTTGAING